MGLVEQALEGATIKTFLIYLAVIFTVWRVYLKINESVRLRKLGARAPRVRSRLPFGK